MGFWRSLLDALGIAGQKVNVLVVGLDNSGKTTIIDKLKPKAAQAQEVTPTVGFAVQEVRSKGVNFAVFDMSGAGKYRSLWEKFYPQAQAIIFAVDAADRLRMVVVREELNALLASKQLSARAPLLVYANKQDLAAAMPAPEVAQQLQLDLIQGRAWQIAACCAPLGRGLEEGMEWLAQALQRA